jgi:acyl-CoA thioesterase-2
MSIVFKKLSDLLHIEQIDTQLFRGISQDLGTGRIFGGQVLGQAIVAAQKTVSDKKIHSAHAYFLRMGNHDLPVVYHVDNTRDGKSYSSRTVTATQQGNIIFTMMCSFQVDEASEFDYAIAPNTECLSLEDGIEVNLEDNLGAINTNGRKIFTPQPFTIRLPNEDTDLTSTTERFNIKTNQTVAGDQSLHNAIFAYLSDFRLLASTLRSVGYRFKVKETMLATICHTIWFHRDIKVDDWLHSIYEPISLIKGRGMAKGAIYNSEGLLLATTMQEGVVRKLK